MTDRTKPPPQWLINRSDDGVWDCWMTHQDAPVPLLHVSMSVSARTKREAVAQAWDIVDAITLPHRVALLRELAAEFQVEVDAQLQESGSDHAGWWAAELRKRADALEASAGQTATPTPPR